MSDYICTIGLDEAESEELGKILGQPLIAHISLPRIRVEDDRLWVEGSNSARLFPVSKVIFHGIYEDDLDFIGALALWGGACLPNPFAMLDCRLKLPCLARALRYTHFPVPGRGYAAPYVRLNPDHEMVAKWGNWHCGENKERFSGGWTAEQPSIIEPFLAGQAVRVVIIGDQAWQIRLAGDNWLQSIHHPAADFMPLDADLLADAHRIKAGFGLEIMANDYLITEQGTKHLLEVNHIPNVSRFPELWAAYRDYVVGWVRT